MSSAYCFSCMNSQVQEEAEACPLCGARLPYSVQNILDLEPGTVLRHRYIIGRCLGRGGFGATYIAHDLQTGEICAVKEYMPFNMASRQKGVPEVSIFDNKRADFTHYMQRFFSEAEQLRSLHHIQGIVRLYDVFSENSTAYFVMEYVDGITLKKHLANRQQGLTPQEALAIVVQLLAILAILHKNGVLHRDISSDNVCILKDGSLKLIDFGSARSTMQSEMTIYTKGVYTAPEQALGRKQGPFTDLYAAGVLLFMLMMGRLPEKQETGMEMLFSDDRGTLQQINRVYAKAVCEDTSMRYQMAEEMMEDIRALPPADEALEAFLARKQRREKSVFARLLSHKLSFSRGRASASKKSRQAGQNSRAEESEGMPSQAGLLLLLVLLIIMLFALLIRAFSS